MKWEQGRQGTGYLKRLLARGETFDVYLIKYPPGSRIPTHTDPVPNKRHYRLNIRLKGEDNFRGQAIFRLWRLCLFRPDITPHSVDPVSEQRLLLSIGWVRDGRDDQEVPSL